MKFLINCLLLLAVFVSVRSQEISMEPAVDPMPKRPGTPKLYISSAGKAPFKEVSIAPSSKLTICPSDFPSGFTIRCEVEGARTVFWRVNDSLFKKEHHEPYYISGNWKDRVGAFKGLETADSLRVGCRVATRKTVWVHLYKSCAPTA